MPERGFLVVGASGWGAGRHVRVLPIAAALAAAGVGGFVFAQWAQRPKAAGVASASAAPSAAPAAASPLPAARVASPTVPPATYAAPHIPAVTRSVVPDAPPRTAAPAEPVAPGPAPTRPAAVPAPPLVEITFSLQAVTEQDGRPVAIVNGQLVRVGDTVEGARVLRIAAQEVELEKDGRRIVVSF